MTTEHWRPLLHFTPQRHWINDPNGLTWHEGEYHLFYQTNPQGSVWGHMSWGHAVSTDLLHWQELPLAIAEDPQWMIFSGSVVADTANCSGFGRGGVVPLVAVYTGSAQQAGPDGSHRQSQHLAYSLDRGRSWTKFAGNPVLDLGGGGFRDPKVFWHAGTERWIMLVSMADEGWLRLFQSADLKSWQPLSEFRQDVPGGSVWECPDLLELGIEGESGTAWLLKWDVFRGHPGGGSGALGIVGRFDGTHFNATQPPEWLDGGMDFYAAIAFGVMPPGDPRRVWLGWMNSHHYGQHTPTHPWRGAMTLPRELTLVRTGGSLQVAQRPVRELLTCRGPVRTPDLVATGSGTHVLVPAGELPAAWELEIVVQADSSEGWALCLAHPQDQGAVVTIELHRASAMLSLTRGPAGLGPDVAGFYGTRRRPWPGAGAAVAGLHVVVDACSVEVFSTTVPSALTEQIFPRPAPLSLTLRSDREVRLQNARWWPLGRRPPRRA